MEALHAQRATILGEAKEFSPTVDYWQTMKEINNAVRRMPLVDDRIKDYMAKYFLTMAAEAVQKSPYRRMKISKKNVARMISDTQELISCGQKDIFDISTNARANVERNLSTVARCARTPEESSIAEGLQRTLLDEIAALLLDETCSKILVTLATILDVSAQVPELKKNLSVADILESSKTAWVVV